MPIAREAQEPARRSAAPIPAGPRTWLGMDFDGSRRRQTLDFLGVELERNGLMGWIDRLHRGKRDHASALPKDIPVTDHDLVRVIAVPLVTDVIDQADVMTVGRENVVALASRKKPAELSTSSLLRRHAGSHHLVSPAEHAIDMRSVRGPCSFVSRRAAGGLIRTSAGDE